MPALERLGGALEALARQRRRPRPLHRGPADLEALGPGAVGQELQAAGALAQRDAERACTPLGISPNTRAAAAAAPNAPQVAVGWKPRS